MDVTNANSTDLLDDLCSGIGCLYLSDLHDRRCLPSVQRVLRGVDPSRYSLREWIDAVYYITGNRLCFESGEQAAQYLIHFGPDAGD